MGARGEEGGGAAAAVLRRLSCHPRRRRRRRRNAGRHVLVLGSRLCQLPARPPRGSASRGWARPWAGSSGLREGSPAGRAGSFALPPTRPPAPLPSRHACLWAAMVDPVLVGCARLFTVCRAHRVNERRGRGSVAPMSRPSITYSYRMTTCTH